MPEWTVTIIVSIIAMVPGVFALVSQLRKDKRDTRRIEVEMAERVQEIARQAMDDLEERLRANEVTIENQAEKILRLEKRLRSREVTIANQSERIQALEKDNQKLTADSEALRKWVQRLQKENIDLRCTLDGV